MMRFPSPRPPSDPTFLHSRREAVVILCLWAVCLVWTVSYSWLFGYGLAAAEAPPVLGLPRWVFWGVALPWGLAAVVSILLAVFYIADDDLGEEATSPVPDDDGHDA